MTGRRAFLLSTAGAALAAAQTKATRIVFGGDVIFSRGVAQRIRSAGGDHGVVFRDLAPVFKAADIAFVNLETPISDKPPFRVAEMIFRAPPEAAPALANAGIDIVSTANNHTRDGQGYGIEYTLGALKRAGIAATGTAATPEELAKGVTLDRNGVRFGFLGYTYDQANGNFPDQDPRVANLEVARMRQEVADLKRRAQVVIVSMHAGWEYFTRPNPHQTSFARAAIEAGASVVAGHHPHVVQGLERYLEGVIFYSLGNLVFDQKQAGTDQGLLAEVTFEGAMLAGYKVMPVDIVDAVPRLSAARRGYEVRMR